MPSKSRPTDTRRMRPWPSTFSSGFPGNSRRPHRTMEKDGLPEDLRRERWFVLALMAVLLYGVYYAYNSVVPLAGALIRARGISRAQYGLLFSYYSLPN